MRPTFRILALYFLLCTSLPSSAQITLNWGTSFSPGWSSGNLTRTASNIGGNTINCTATIGITGGGAFVQTGITTGSQTPTVAGAVFTVPDASNRVHITPNYSTNTAYTTITLSFTTYVSNLSFRIADIDKKIFR